MTSFPKHSLTLSIDYVKTSYEIGAKMGHGNKHLHILIVLFVFLGILLTSCGINQNNQQDKKHLVTLEITKSSNKKTIEDFFDGEIVGWYPSANTAIVKTDKIVTQDQISQQGLVLDTFRIAASESKELQVVMPVAQNGGSAWANGGSAWANGGSAWANGVHGGYFTPNKIAFDQINLFPTHALSKNLGEGIKVAVIDAGLDIHHPMFQDRLTPKSEWKDYIDNDNLPDEYGSPELAGFGHGTAVAGIILQVAPRATILPIRVIDENGLGDTDKVAEAIEWAVSQKVDIINLSLGTDAVSGAIQAMLIYAHNEGIYTIASAGNTGTEEVLFPANVKNELNVDLANDETWKNITKDWENKTSILGVASVNTNDTLSTFSSYGQSIDLTAPGEGIVTAYPFSMLATVSGTSFAAPMVTGSLALALAEENQTIDKQAMLEVLVATSESINENNIADVIGKIGKGRLDTYNFMNTGRNWPELSESAYGKLAWPIPGNIEAEHFDEGGQNVAYYDSDLGIKSSLSWVQSCREDTDVETRVKYDGSCAISTVRAGEWLNYTIRAAKTSTVQISIDASAEIIGGSIEVLLDNTTLGNITTPTTYSLENFEEVIVSEVTISEGVHTFTLKMTANGSNNQVGNIDKIKFTELSTSTQPTPAQPEPTQPTQPEPTQPTQPEPTQPVASTLAFGGQPVALPGIVEAENFDVGGPNVSYVDNDNWNRGNEHNTPCRSETQVDTGRHGVDGCKINWNQPGEWLNYTIEVAATGTYNIVAATSAFNWGGNYVIEIDGQVITNSQVPASWNWDTFSQTTIADSVYLEKGVHVMTLRIISDGPEGYVGDFDYFKFELNQP